MGLLSNQENTENERKRREEDEEVRLGPAAASFICLSKGPCPHSRGLSRARADVN